MKVGVFLETINYPHYRMCLEQFALGLKKCGVDYFTADSKTFSPCDVAIFYGAWKNRTTPRHVMRKYIYDSGMPFIALETPLLGRILTDRPRYLRAGVGHFVNTLGNFNNKNKTSDRWNKLTADLNIDVKPWRNYGQYILLALQQPDDGSLLGANISKWAYDTVLEIRRYSNRPIVIRAHPKPRQYDMDLIRKACEVSDVTYASPNAVTMKQHLQSAWATVTYTSGLAIDSVVSGVPAYGMSPGSFVYDLEHDLSTIGNPKTYDRSQWLNDMAYTQWTPDEMAEGLPWLHLKDVLHP